MAIATPAQAKAIFEGIEIYNETPSGVGGARVSSDNKPAFLKFLSEKGVPQEVLGEYLGIISPYTGLVIEKERLEEIASRFNDRGVV